mgnify:CR=1 FL=1|tara:strand:- start:104 stop:634 length:531 start_codon:yes stop_codon:yes gene_type:complete
MSDFKIDDWVLSVNSGLWRVYRIDNFKCIDPVSEKLEDKTLIFVKRFVNDSGKRSFTQNVFCPSLLVKIEDEGLSEIEEFIRENKELYKKFEAFKPKLIDSIYARNITAPEDKSASEIAALIPKGKKVTQLDIVRIVEGLGYGSKDYPHWTIQFISKGTELENGFVQYTFGQVLEF